MLALNPYPQPIGESRRVPVTLPCLRCRQICRSKFLGAAALTERSDPRRDVAAERGFDDVTGLAAAAHAEAQRFVEHMVFSGQTFAELMRSPRAFPESQLLAQVMGTEVTGASLPQVFAPDHPGLLHRPALLLSSGRRTNLIVRGAHVRKLFLCTPLPLPTDVEAVADQATSRVCYPRRLATYRRRSVNQ